MARKADTIAALATPAGTSALALIRISGPDTRCVCAAALGREPEPRHAAHGDYVDASGCVLDDVVFTFFAGPHSFTAEDTLEISCHGNPYIVRRILSDLAARGCRPAEPGEFSKRAFLNGAMDLSQAEAVMDVIRARSDRALAAAQQVLRGALGRHMSTLVGGLLRAIASVEARIDFPEEGLPPEERGLLERQVGSVLEGAERLLATERTGALLRDGISTVIIGEPNAGKSSLLNRIVGSERAIVSAEPGTTRDFIEERVIVGGHLLRLVDTAGLNPGAAGTERLGVERALERAAEADLLLLVIDPARATPALPDAVATRIAPSNTIVVMSKADLPGAGPAPHAAPAGFSSVRVSALTGQGIEDLLAEISRFADSMQNTAGEERIAINARHAHFLAQARDRLRGALAIIRASGPEELAASDLRLALGALGEISGRLDNERVLDELFATFCIGK